MLYDLSSSSEHEIKPKRTGRISSDSNGTDNVATGDDNGSDGETRKIYILRHGERVDFTFGPWIPYCFDEAGTYIRKDLNMPNVLPNRVNSPKSWLKDSPLTNIGVYQAVLTGEAMKDADVEISYAYCSPSYRCIQTCNGLLEGKYLILKNTKKRNKRKEKLFLGLGVKNSLCIRIEPGLFEWMAWYPDDMPEWCTAKELKDANYNIDSSYVPILTSEQLQADAKELCEEFYHRNHLVVETILGQHRKLYICLFISCKLIRFLYS